MRMWPAAACSGAKTVLIERFGYPGGTATASLMACINGFRTYFLRCHPGGGRAARGRHRKRAGPPGDHGPGRGGCQQGCRCGRSRHHDGRMCRIRFGKSRPAGQFACDFGSSTADIPLLQDALAFQGAELRR
ncbi:MAG: hypothetical protein IT210_26080 [Armatimonadetes bacterium]|nr:hypothetical protein [Armatimonadota bacterium]